MIFHRSFATGFSRSQRNDYLSLRSVCPLKSVCVCVCVGRTKRHVLLNTLHNECVCICVCWVQMVLCRLHAGGPSGCQHTHTHTHLLEMARHLKDIRGHSHTAGGFWDCVCMLSRSRRNMHEDKLYTRFLLPRPPTLHSSRPPLMMDYSSVSAPKLLSVSFIFFEEKHVS